MIITKPVLNAIRADFDGSFQEGVASANLVYEPIVRKVPSSSKKNIYGFMQEQMKLREWKGARIRRALAESGFEVVNRKFQESVEIPREDIEDDILGVYRDEVFPMLGRAVKQFPQQLLVEQLQSNSGAGPTAYDGNALFTDSRDYGGGNIDNVLSGSPFALTPDNFQTAWNTMASFRGANGEPLGRMATHLIIPPQLKREALEVSQASVNYVAAGSSNQRGAVDNVMRGWVDVIVIPELSNQANIWYLADLSLPSKPIYFQERTSPELTARMNLDDPDVFEQDVFIWGTRYRCEIAAGHPDMIIKSSLATS